MYALSRTTASTWGGTMEKALHIYLAVVRPALSYGAAQPKGKGPKRASREASKAPEPRA